MYFMYLTFLNPFLLGDPENFIPANPLLTPLHIQPEWYFLFVYAILRSIPNKLGGVVTLVAALAVLFFLPFMALPIIKTNHFNPLGQILFWFIVSTFLLLTWIGMRPIEAPYDSLGAFLTILYFILFAFLPISLHVNTKLLLLS